MTSVEAIVRHFSCEAVVFAFQNGDDGQSEALGLVRPSSIQVPDGVARILEGASKEQVAEVLGLGSRMRVVVVKRQECKPYDFTHVQDDGSPAEVSVCPTWIADSAELLEAEQVAIGLDVDEIGDMEGQLTDMFQNGGAGKEGLDDGEEGTDGKGEATDQEAIEKDVATKEEAIKDVATDQEAIEKQEVPEEEKAIEKEDVAAEEVPKEASEDKAVDVIECNADLDLSKESEQKSPSSQKHVPEEENNHEMTEPAENNKAEQSESVADNPDAKEHQAQQNESESQQEDDEDVELSKAIAESANDENEQVMETSVDPSTPEDNGNDDEEEEDVLIIGLSNVHNELDYEWETASTTGSPKPGGDKAEKAENAANSQKATDGAKSLPGAITVCKAKVVQLKRPAKIRQKSKITSGFMEILDGKYAGKRVLFLASSLYVWGHHLNKADLLYNLKAGDQFTVEVNEAVNFDYPPGEGEATLIVRKGWMGPILEAPSNATSDLTFISFLASKSLDYPSFQRWIQDQLPRKPYFPLSAKFHHGELQFLIKHSGIDGDGGVLMIAEGDYAGKLVAFERDDFYVYGVHVGRADMKVFLKPGDTVKCHVQEMSSAEKKRFKKLTKSEEDIGHVAYLAYVGLKPPRSATLGAEHSLELKDCLEKKGLTVAEFVTMQKPNGEDEDEVVLVEEPNRVAAAKAAAAATMTTTENLANATAAAGATTTPNANKSVLASTLTAKAMMLSSENDPRVISLLSTQEEVHVAVFLAKVLTASLVAKMRTAMAPAMQQVYGTNLTSTLSNQAVQLAQLATFFSQGAGVGGVPPRNPLVHSFPRPPPPRPQPVNPFTAATYQTAFAVLQQAAVRAPTATTPVTISAAPTVNAVKPQGSVVVSASAAATPAPITDKTLAAVEAKIRAEEISKKLVADKGKEDNSKKLKSMLQAFKATKNSNPPGHSVKSASPPKRRTPEQVRSSDNRGRDSKSSGRERESDRERNTWNDRDARSSGRDVSRDGRSAGREREADRDRNPWNDRDARDARSAGRDGSRDGRSAGRDTNHRDSRSTGRELQSNVRDLRDVIGADRDRDRGRDWSSSKRPRTKSRSPPRKRFSPESDDIVFVGSVQQHKETAAAATSRLDTDPFERQMTSLELLRHYVMRRKAIVEAGDELFFGNLVFAKDVRTNFKVTRNSELEAEFYSLDTLRYFYNNCGMDHAAYVRQALRDNVSAVKRPDRDAVLDYLTGRKTTVPNLAEQQRLEPARPNASGMALPQPAPIQSSQHEKQVLSSIEGWREKYIGAGRQKPSSVQSGPGVNVWTSGSAGQQSSDGRQQAAAAAAAAAQFINPWQINPGAPSVWK